MCQFKHIKAGLCPHVVPTLTPTLQSSIPIPCHFSVPNLTFTVEVIKHQGGSRHWHTLKHQHHHSYIIMPSTAGTWLLNGKMEISEISWQCAGEKKPSALSCILSLLPAGSLSYSRGEQKEYSSQILHILFASFNNTVILIVPKSKQATRCLLSLRTNPSRLQLTMAKNSRHDYVQQIYLSRRGGEWIWQI